MSSMGMVPGMMPWMVPSMPGMMPNMVPGMMPSMPGMMSAMWSSDAPSAVAPSPSGKASKQGSAPPSKIPDEEKTTVMLRNLPNDYKRHDLLQLLNDHSFKGKYDFVYLPTDFRHEAGFGYAFVNLISHAEADEVIKRFQGYDKWKVPSKKAVDVMWGDPYQGKDAHVNRYRNSPVMHESVHEEHKPMIFENGEQVTFPPPTKKIRQPRIKRRCGHDGVGAPAGLEDMNANVTGLTGHVSHID